MADGTRSWSHGETAALIEAWRLLYHRRRAGECDVWLSEKERLRVRSTGSLVTADWRAMATAVNGYRAELRLQPIRTHRHCKSRVDRLRIEFGDELLTASGWYGFMTNSTASGRGGGLRMSSLNVLATAAAHNGGGRARAAAGVVTGAFAAAKNSTNGVPVPVPVPVPVVEEDEDAPSEPAAAMTTGIFLGVPVPKKRRTGASASTSTPAAAGAEGGRAASVKAELVREANDRVVAGRAPPVASLPEMAAESDDVKVVVKLSEMYMEVVKKRIELQSQMLAAQGAAAGGAAAPEPDVVARA